MTVWTLPPEPAPEVRRVWDRLGLRWERDAGDPTWWWDVGTTDPGLALRPRTWLELLTRGPITDVEPATVDEAEVGPFPVDLRIRQDPEVTS